MHVLIADDDHAFAEILTELVSNAEGVDLITVAHDGAAALRAVDEVESLAAAILDISMPLASGIQVVKKIRERTPYTVIIILTGTEDKEAERTALSNGADLLLHKGDYVEQLTEALAVAERRKSWPKARVRKL